MSIVNGVVGSSYYCSGFGATFSTDFLSLLRHAALNLLRCSSRTCQRFVSIAMVTTVVVWVIAPIIAPFVGPQSLVAVCIEA